MPCNRALSRVPLTRENSPPSSVMSSAFVFVLGLCMVTPALAQLPPATTLSTIPGGTPPINATGFAVGNLCPPLPRGTGAQADLKERCTEIVVNGNRQSTLDPLLQVSSEKIPTEGTTQVEAARVQIANVGTRLVELRRGVTGISIQGLAFNMNGRTLPGTMLAGLLPGNDGRDVTNAYAPTIFPKFEASTSPKTSPGTVLANLLSQSKSDGTGSSGNPSLFDKLGVFANGTFTWGDKDPTSREAGFDFDTLGMTAGIDYRFTDRFIFGAAFGFASTDADLDLSGGNIDTTQYSGSMYGTYYFDRLYVDGIMTIGWNTFDSKRNVIYSIPGTVEVTDPVTGMSRRIQSGTTSVNQTFKGDTDGVSYSLGFGGGYEFRSRGFTFGPYGRLNYFKIDIDGFGESAENTDAGFGWALAFHGQTIESLTTALGGQATYALSTQVAVFVPQLLFEWVHEFLNSSRLIAANFVNDPFANKVPLNYRADSPDRNFFNLGFGMSAVFRGGTSAFVYYQTALAFENITKNDVVVGVRLAF
jgi:outer membrane lipase/esterase